LYIVLSEVVLKAYLLFRSKPYLGVLGNLVCYYGKFLVFSNFPSCLLCLLRFRFWPWLHYFFFSYIFHLWEKIPKKKLGIDVKEKLKLEIGEIILWKGGCSPKDFEVLFEEKKRKTQLRHKENTGEDIEPILFENINKNKDSSKETVQK